MAKQFTKRDRRFLGIGVQGAIRGFFGGNAFLSIAILALICLFLIKEAYQFFPQHHAGLQLYRQSGLEYVDHIKRQVDGHTKLEGLVAQAYYAELEDIAGKERSIVEAFYGMSDLASSKGEDQIDALYEAQEALAELEEQDDKEATARAREAEKAARSNWLSALERIANSFVREEIDPYGRLAGDDWTLLVESLQEWDPVNEVPPPLVSNAEEDMATKMSSFEEAKTEFESAVVELRDFKERFRMTAMAGKDEAVADLTAEARKKALMEGAAAAQDPEERERMAGEAAAIVIQETFPYDAKAVQYYESKEEHAKLAEAYLEKLEAAIKSLPKVPGSERALQSFEELKRGLPEFLTEFEKDSGNLQEWRHDEPFSMGISILMFFFGKDWVTNSDWHEFFGLLPLLTGSLMISVIALIVAVPFSIGAAIYVNQLARRWEQNLIKPAIEFIQAIPSVVLGFFGIMVLGTALREMSNWELLAWVPGFPMQERLNILNAGLLLGLMAVPTIFTLCEDALNNVPKALTESSLALGASKLQTILRVLVPAAISGIFAAILLGFGRVIGETMVVLLVAGNQIAIPDFSQGIGVVTQPAHTMTGIIAQETGEVAQGSLHWRALFMVGLILFAISLLINWIAQKIILKFRTV